MSFQQNCSLMKYANHLAIFVVCLFGLAGCLAGSGKQVRFTCDDSIVPSTLEKQFMSIAKAHHFFLAPPESGGLRFYSHIKATPSLYAVVSQSHPPEIIFGISIMRGPGTEDKLPPEVHEVFNSIVREMNTQVEKNCTLQKLE